MLFFQEKIFGLFEKRQIPQYNENTGKLEGFEGRRVLQF